MNALLDAEADRPCNAQRYERSAARCDTRAGHYERIAPLSATMVSSACLCIGAPRRLHTYWFRHAGNPRQPLEIIRTLAAAVMTACGRLSGSEIGIVVVRLPHALGRLEQLALAWQPLLGASQVFVPGFVVADGRMLLKPPPSPRPRPWRAAMPAVATKRARTSETFARFPHERALGLRGRIGADGWVLLVEIDRLILKGHGCNPVRLTNHRLRKLGISRSAKLRQLRKLEAAGVIQMKAEERKWTLVTHLWFPVQG